MSEQTDQAIQQARESLDPERLRRLAMILRDEHGNGVPPAITQRAAEVIEQLSASRASLEAKIDFALARQQQNHQDAIALIREAHATQVASLEEEIARLTEELHAMGDNRDKWKAQCEANSEELTRLDAEAALQSRASQETYPDGTVRTRWELAPGAKDLDR